MSAKNVQSLATAATPFNTLADRFGDGTLSVFVNLAVISSFTALNIVTVVAVSRIFWKMGRDGLLPSAFGRLNARQSPHVACLFAGALALVTSILFGAIWGALNFASWLSYFATLFFIAAYLLISVGLIRFMWRDYRQEFSWIRHALLPVISIAAMIWVLWGNIHPYPPAPLRWFIYATVGVLVIKCLIAQWLDRDQARRDAAGQRVCSPTSRPSVRTLWPDQARPTARWPSFFESREGRHDHHQPAGRAQRPDPATYTEITEAFGQIDRDPGILVGIVTGAGRSAFTATLT